MTQLLRLPANTAGRDYVVGDLHGCYDDLQELLALASFDATRDRLIAVGDLIDRGPKNAECIRLLEQPWFYSVMGNHEALMIQSMAERGEWTGYNPIYQCWMSNGGTWIHGHVPAEQDELLAMVLDLPLAIVVGDQPGQQFGVLHAEYHQTGAELLVGQFDDEDEQAMLWGRDILSGRYRQPPDIAFPVYVGHSIVSGVTERGPFRYIDTGSFLANVGRGHLTMIDTKTTRVWSTRPTGDALDWENAA